jgi:fructose-1,6-bisphosphatase/inositol monophosphatase family enzyme
MNPLVCTALEAAEAAARVHLLHFGRFRVDEVREKGRSDFVSMVDLEAQEAAAAVIRSRHPEHRILAEEEVGGSERVDRGEVGDRIEVGDDGKDPETRRWPDDGSFLWIVDPLDGTTNYLHRHPMFAASVAVGRSVREGEEEPGRRPQAGTEEPGRRMEAGAEEPGRRTEAGTEAGGGAAEATMPAGVTKAGGGISPFAAGITVPWQAGTLEAGAVVAPRTGERWWAHRGGGAWKNGRLIRVSGLRSLRSALVGTGFPFKEPHLLPRYAEQFERVLPASGGVRRGGSAALDLCYLAEGILDAFWEEEYLAPWDVAAGLLLVQEAGGMATRLDGRAFDLENGSVLAANSPELMAGLGRAVRGGKMDGSGA